MKQPTDNQAFFTAGVGNIPADQNSFESENNLDLTNNSTSWAPEHDMRSIGNKAILSPEIPTSQPETNTPIDNPKDTLQETIDVLAPPTSELSQPTTGSTAFDSKLIRTDGDHISKKAISEVDHVISKFTQAGDAADLYATIRGDDTHPGMVRDNLKNSFNREVA